MRRKEFLGLSASALASLGFGRLPSREEDGANQAQSSDAPDLVVTGATVITMDPATPVAEAFAVRHGRFVAVGRTSDVRNLVAAGRTRVIDARGLTIVPGFIDAHSHPSSGGLSELKDVNTNLGSIAKIKEAIARRAASVPPRTWIVGFMYDDTRLSEGRPLTRKDLDEVAPNHPVAVGHRGGHTGVYNSLAFQLAGVTAQTPDPEGGKFYRENGELTGKVAELARGVFARLIPSSSTREERAKGVALISKLMSASGLTTVHQTGCSRDDFIAYQDARDAGELRFRSYLFPRGPFIEQLMQAGVRTGFGDDRVKIGGVKYAADGSASERTMRMSTPYVGRKDDFGILTMSQEDLHRVVDQAHQAGWQIGIHANGDVTIDMVLEAYERAQRQWPRPDARHRIEHCSLVNPDLLRRIKTLGVIPTPFYTYAYYHGNKWLEYGPEKMEWMFAHRSFLDAGIPAAAASDFTPGPYEPMMALQSMVTRTDSEGRVWGASQRITVDQALTVCTVNAARASFEESSKGSITAGKLADFVILEKNPRTTDAMALKDIKVLRTVVGGATVHEL